MNEIFKNVLIVGCGDIGVRVARLIRARGGTVTAVSRSYSNEARLEEQGLKVVSGNLDDPDALHSLNASGQLVFYLAPPPGGGPLDTRMRHFCQAVGKDRAPARVVYVSTSGVYGDCGGEWVTEETPIKPQTSRAQRRADAEKTLQEWGRINGVAVVILRVTGIYGPGRLPLARIEQGHPILLEADSPPTNRIHADDLAEVCVTAAEKADDGDIFNVSDGHPGTMTHYFNVITDLLGLPRLPQIDMQEAKQVMNPMMLSYLTESRRMDNRKMMERLGVTLKYPDLESGLKNVVAQLDQPKMGYLGSVGH